MPTLGLIATMALRTLLGDAQALVDASLAHVARDEDAAW